MYRRALPSRGWPEKAIPGPSLRPPWSPASRSGAVSATRRSSPAGSHPRASSLGRDLNSNGHHACSRPISAEPLASGQGSTRTLGNHDLRRCAAPGRDRGTLRLRWSDRNYPFHGLGRAELGPTLKRGGSCYLLTSFVLPGAGHLIGKTSLSTSRRRTVRGISGRR